MGLFPRLRDGAPHNGGVPQAANLSAHLANLRATVPRWIPDPEWDGLAVFDFEEWTNVWELMIAPTAGGGWHSVAYQNYSVELERRAHPGWSEAQLRAAAKLSFESAATDFLVQTLRLCRARRVGVDRSVGGSDPYESCSGAARRFEYESGERVVKFNYF